MSEVIISVRGENERRIEPERGTVRLSVRADGPERGPVVERIAALAVPVREQLEERKASGAVTEWSSERVSVWSDRPWNQDGTQLPLVHHASVDISATFGDFAALSWWVGEVSEADGVHVGGIEWTLTPETSRLTESDVAAQAVQTAVARATAYARALGLATVTPVEVADLGLLARGQSESGGAQPKMMRAMAMDAGVGGAPSFDFQPADIVVSAAVEARFSAR